MAKKDTETTYYVEKTNGQDQKVTVPSGWKVTFGPQNPGVKGHGPTGEPCLRFYESANQQRMVITGVKSFRDMAIKVEEKRVTNKQESFRKADADGVEKVVVLNGSMEEWVNPDEPRPASPTYNLIEEPQIVKKRHYEETSINEASEASDTAFGLSAGQAAQNNVYRRK